MSDALIKISTIITTYNSEASIQRVLDSIKNQEGNHHLFEIEYLIIDDCSTDNTVNIIKSNHLEYISTGTNSGGPNKGRNIGLKKATGDYICIVDHDDEWHQNKLKSMLPYFDQSLIISSGFTTYDAESGKTTVKVNQSHDNKPYVVFDANVTFMDILTRSLKGQNRYLGSMIYSSKLKHVLFEEVYGMIDFDWGLRLFHNQTSIEVCDSLYTRHLSKSNLSFNEQYRLNDFTYSVNYVMEYKKQYPAEVALSIKKMNGSLARYYYFTSHMKKARRYFLKSDFSLKTVFYYLTTFVGSNFVKRKFNVFG